MTFDEIKKAQEIFNTYGVPLDEVPASVLEDALMTINRAINDNPELQKVFVLGEAIEELTNDI